MSNEIPLNQVYMVDKTLKEYPDLAEIKKNYEKYCLEDVKWHKFGRSYDCSVSLLQVDFEDKIVCELGARDSIFSSYLTKYVKKVYASDTFIGWGDLGDLKYWDTLWKKFAFNPERHVSEFQDMRKLSYPDNSMDIVVSFSAIEHIPEDGDILSAKEMGRVCKPEGFVIIGTDICRNHIWHRGGYFYDEKSFFERIVKQSECEIIGDYDFRFEESDRSFVDGLESTSLIFVLRKKVKK